jgi:hypothetical protein
MLYCWSRGWFVKWWAYRGVAGTQVRLRWVWPSSVVTGRPN